MSDRFQVLGIGNAIVDILAVVEERFISDHRMIKGSMNLVSADQAAAIYDVMPATREQSGGSVANSIAGIAMLGGKAAYIGKVASDQLGQIFRHDMKAIDVDFDTPPLEDGESTASSLVCITPDTQRTMNTYLGACAALSLADIPKVKIDHADITYIEGYLWDREHAKEACRLAMAMTAAAGGRVAFTLSDSFCVDRYRGDFNRLVDGSIDILFTNRDEICSLYQTDDLEEALSILAGKTEIAAVTCGSEGAIILSGDQRYSVPSVKTDVVDTTGAGDMFAAGFLFGLSNGYGLEKSGKLGCAAASLCISRVGPRPDAEALRALLETL